VNNRSANEEPLETIGPYVGLRPYEESNRDIFFGREDEREIIIDKLIANKLTLLFAATGVGKSSLLRAAVLPELKQMKKESLDVVYYSDWVSDPLENLKKETVAVLRTQKRVGEDYPVYRKDEGISLKKFFRLCATFASEPLVVILDQFEEFFQYRRYKENFMRFIEEFSECVKDRETQVVFLISMREDFALELNAFKNYLPTILFENYFRLEKLTEAKAREAIAKPVARFGFHYEEKLLDTLLKNLAEREEEARLGTSPASLGKDMPAYVEPPYLQIVCSRLWEADRNDPEQKIRTESYDKMGEVNGIVDSYFHEVMNQLSPSEKKIVSRAFNYLVTPRGTKVAYPLEDLANILAVDEKKLSNVLEKLRKSRILRTQKRKDVIWYELYHDVFSNIIYLWKEKIKKRKNRIKIYTMIGVSIIYFIFILIVTGIIHLFDYHFRVVLKETTSNHIEIYRGPAKSDISNILNMSKYNAETIYQENDLEDRYELFFGKRISDFDNLNEELICLLHVKDRILAYWEAGEFKKAWELANESILEPDVINNQQILDILAVYGFNKSYEALKKHLDKPYNINKRQQIIYALSLMPPNLILDDFIDLLNDEMFEVRRKAVSVLGKIGNEKAVFPLLRLLKDMDTEVRRRTVEALGKIGNEKAVDSLIQVLQDSDKEVRTKAVETLGKIGSEKAMSELNRLLKNPDHELWTTAALTLVENVDEKSMRLLIQLLKNPDSKVRSGMAEVLGKFGSEKSEDILIQLLKDVDWEVQRSAINAIGEIGSEKAVISLIKILKAPDFLVKSRVIEALGKLGSEMAVNPLIDLLTDPDEYVRSNLVDALGQIGSEKAVLPLINLLKDPDSALKSRTAYALGKIGSDNAVSPLISLLKHQNSKVQSSAAEALGEIGSEKAVPPLINLLEVANSTVKSSTVESLGKIGSEKAVPSLIRMLKDLDSNVRRRSADALGKIGSEKATNSLIERLRDPDEKVQDCAVSALVAIGSEKVVIALLGLIEDPDEHVRSFTVMALGRLGSEQAIASILQFLKGRDNDTLRSGAEVLGELGSSIAVEPLIKLLKDHNSSVRISASYALGEIGSPIAVKPLIKLLKDQDSAVRISASHALGELCSKKAFKYLIGLLKCKDSDVRSSAAYALGGLGSTKAIEPLASLLNDIEPEVRKIAVLSLGKLCAREKTGAIKNLYTNKNEKPHVRLTAAATLLKMGDETGLEYLKEVSKQDIVNRRIEVAEIMGEAPSKQGTFLLIEMLNDENIRVKENVIISLGKAKAVSSLPYLKKLIQEPNLSIREAVVNALSEIASSDSIELLKNVAGSTGERIPTRAKAIATLAKIPHKDALQALIELLDNENTIVKYKTIMAIGKNPPSQAIPDDLINQLKSRLYDKLKVLEKRKAKWRKIRDESTEDYNQEQMDEWRSRLKEVEPREPLEFEHAFALSRIDPENEGIKLLGHHLANVREGAWMGVGKSGKVSLVEKLYWKRKQSDTPWFRHAAYRAIDHILINIEAFGGKEELNDLKALLNKLKEKEGDKIHEGVHSRMEWTIERLKERVNQ
jgi:HEAT repeat protein